MTRPRLRRLMACLTFTAAGWTQAVIAQNAAPQEAEAPNGLVVYIDATLARSAEILALSTALAERAETLADFDEVTVVVADSEPHVHFRGSELASIRQGLSTLGLRTFGDEELVTLRSNYAEAGAAVVAQPELRLENARLEAELLQNRFDTLFAWLADSGSPGAATTLLLLEPALGVDPWSFYSLTEEGSLPSVDDLVSIAAAWGWRVSPVGLIEEEGGLRVGPPDPGIGIGVKINFPPRGEDTGFRPDLQLDIDRDLYARLAERAGGVPVHVQPDLDRVLDSANTTPDPQRVSEPLPEALIQARGRLFLDGGDEGEVELLPTLERVDDEFRLSVSVDPELSLEGDDHVVHVLAYEDTTAARIESFAWPQGAHSWSSSQSLPADVDQVAVLFSAVDGDPWGMAFASERALEADVPAAVPDRQALLQIPDLPTRGLSGRQEITIEAGPEIDWVEVLLDGRRIDTDRRRPFRSRLSLGAAAIEHSLVVIGYDAERREIARTGRTLNSAGRFEVEIASPRRLSAGPTDVTAAVTIPGDRGVRSVDFYWRTERLARLTSPPWRQRVLVPLDRDEDGYLRVVATLDDGRVSEDILLAGRDNFSSQVTVELMELYVVVTGRDERPVRDLGVDAFRILEQGQTQDVAHFRAAGDLPLTVGLAIDSSLSLFKKLPDVQKAAKGFVRALAPSRDRAFLVGFGNRPELEQPPTWDLDSVVAGIGALKPSGNTAVWQAVDFSLDQLQAISGRRALVVFYDGDDEDLSFPFSATLEKARDSQLPVYLVVLNDEAARTQGKGFAVRSRIGRLEKLAAAGGGRVFYVRTDQDLDEVFDQIAEELRSHYLLAYYPEDPTIEPEWRPVRVEVERQGMQARTVEGYVR